MGVYRSPPQGVIPVVWQHLCKKYVKKFVVCIVSGFMQTFFHLVLDSWVVPIIQ
jgi:hypothetical protein